METIKPASIRWKKYVKKMERRQTIESGIMIVIICAIFVYLLP
jgi:hypothetical protein